jgi:hypothetical protein
MLLPMPENAAREISLVNHLIFAACRTGAGSSYLFNELIRMIDLAYYVQDVGFGDTDMIIYARAEAMERVLQRAEYARARTLDANDITFRGDIAQVGSPARERTAPCSSWRAVATGHYVGH